MDPENSSLSTADFSFHQDPPGNSGSDVDDITPNINEPSTENNTEFEIHCSLRTLGTWYFPLYYLSDESVLEIEFDAGVTPPSTTLPTHFECGQSLSLDSIGSFDLKDTVLYPVPVIEVEKAALKSCQIEENYYHPYPRFPFYVTQRSSPFYRTLKFNHPYRFLKYQGTRKVVRSRRNCLVSGNLESH
jgi:hypothetical protein